MQSNSSQFEINTAPNCKLQISKVYCRLVNYEPKTPLKQLRGHLFGMLTVMVLYSSVDQCNFFSISLRLNDQESMNIF